MEEEEEQVGEEEEYRCVNCGKEEGGGYLFGEDEQPMKVGICTDTLTEFLICHQCHSDNNSADLISHNQINLKLESETLNIREQVAEEESEEDLYEQFGVKREEKYRVDAEKISLNFPMHRDKRVTGKKAHIIQQQISDGGLTVGGFGGQRAEFVPDDDWHFYSGIKNRFKDQQTGKLETPPVLNVNNWISMLTYGLFPGSGDSGDPQSHILLQSFKSFYRAGIEGFLRETLLDLSVLQREIPGRHRKRVSEHLICLMLDSKRSEPGSNCGASLIQDWPLKRSALEARINRELTAESKTVETTQGGKRCRRMFLKQCVDGKKKVRLESLLKGFHSSDLYLENEEDLER